RIRDGVEALPRNWVECGIFPSVGRSPCTGRPSVGIFIGIPSTWCGVCPWRSCTAPRISWQRPERPAHWLHRIPRGIPTVLHQELHWLLYTELLELPYGQEGRVSHRDALLESILAEPEIAALCDAYLTQLHSLADRPVFRATLEQHLAEY